MYKKGVKIQKSRKYKEIRKNNKLKERNVKQRVEVADKQTQ